MNIQVLQNFTMLYLQYSFCSAYHLELEKLKMIISHKSIDNFKELSLIDIVSKFLVVQLHRTPVIF